MSRALDRLRRRLGTGTAPAGTAALAQCLALVPKAEAAVPSWTASPVASALDPLKAPAAGGILTLSSAWKAGLWGAGAAAGICGAVLIPQNIKLRRALAAAAMNPAAKVELGSNLSSPPPPRAGTANNPAGSFEDRIRLLEAKLADKSAREQMVVLNLKRARERADRDRQTFSADELTELESAYQLAKQEPDAARHADALRPLLAQFATSNRAGCAVLRLARLTTGPAREQWLQQAMAHHSDSYYLDGTSVGAMARLQLAAEWAHRGRHAEAARLRQEIEDLFPDATDHDGLPVLDSLAGTTRPD